jgi:hypothetical protein
MRVSVWSKLVAKYGIQGASFSGSHTKLRIPCSENLTFLSPWFCSESIGRRVRGEYNLPIGVYFNWLQKKLQIPFIVPSTTINHVNMNKNIRQVSRIGTAGDNVFCNKTIALCTWLHCYHYVTYNLSYKTVALFTWLHCYHYVTCNLSYKTGIHADMEV